jgi:hypothetical protein
MSIDLHFANLSRRDILEVCQIRVRVPDIPLEILVAKEPVNLFYSRKSTDSGLGRNSVDHVVPQVDCMIREKLATIANLSTPARRHDASQVQVVS